MSNTLKISLSIVFLVTILGFFFLMVWYTAYRLHVHFYGASFWALQTGVAVVAIGSFAVSSFAGKFTNIFVRISSIIGGYAFLFLFFSFILFAALHIIQLRWELPLLWSGVAVLATAFAVIFMGAVFGSSFIVKKNEVKIVGIEKGVSIMLVSDVHLGHQRGQAYLTKIVEETNKLHPDMVLIAGDLIEAELALLPGVLDPLSKFKAPVYFTEGNHDRYLGIERVLKLIQKQGVRILHNEIVETHGIQLIGLDYMKADEKTFDMHPSDNPNTVKSVLARLPLKNGVPSILMHHSPVGVQYADAAGIDLMLSGHTHAGQVFPFSLFAKLSFPFNSGLYQQGKTRVFVSNGAGTYMMRVRLGSFNEINFLKLVPGNSLGRGAKNAIP